MVYTKKTDWRNQPVFFDLGILVGLSVFSSGHGFSRTEDYSFTMS